MAPFKSYRSYQIFEWKAKRGNRFIHDSETLAFLKAVYTTSKEREMSVLKNNVLWRAQLGNDWRDVKVDDDYVEEPCPFEKKRMKPLLNMSTEGRINPKGISYLYIASDKETAMSEVRPWLNSYISVGQFIILKDLRLIDCSFNFKKDFRIYPFNEPTPKKRKEAVWLDIDNAFSKPVNPSDNIADYVPTQILSEFLKTKGYDGIVYKSTLGEGYNVVLFDINTAELINCFLYKTKHVSFDFEKEPNQYFEQKHYKSKKIERGNKKDK